jgi:hypothetical protein
MAILGGAPDAFTLVPRSRGVIVFAAIRIESPANWTAGPKRKQAALTLTNA